MADLACSRIYSRAVCTEWTKVGSGGEGVDGWVAFRQWSFVKEELVVPVSRGQTAKQGQSPALRPIPTSGLPFTTGTRVCLTEVQVAFRGLVTPSNNQSNI